MFKLTDREIKTLVSQSVIPSKKHFGGAKPFVFIEQGVFFDGQIFDPYVFVSDLIKRVRRSIILILEDKEIYHIGASLKDLGKKWFAFSKFDKGALEILRRLK